MRATEMYELLINARDELRRGVFRPGEVGGFTHVNYCRFCHFSEKHVALHGHASACLIDRLERATADSSDQPSEQQRAELETAQSAGAPGGSGGVPDSQATGNAAQSGNSRCCGGSMGKTGL